MALEAVVRDVDDMIFDYTTANRVGMHGHLAAEGLLDGYDSVEEALVSRRQVCEVHAGR
ncbi:hypothetical protein AB0L99_14275 [Streptomyces sp. NPDC051954]|uniref:hypothetical protein n=1 Tax=unclassified Streptomyces TaxID=2593676 RepID=UPI003441C0FB